MRMIWIVLLMLAAGCAVDEPLPEVDPLLGSVEVSSTVPLESSTTSVEPPASEPVESSSTAVPESSVAPSTAPPSTAAPTTEAPTTAVPSTEAPAPPSTEAAVWYENCDAARAAGVAPLRRGDAGYRSGLDRDGDGVACE